MATEELIFLPFTFGDRGVAECRAWAGRVGIDRKREAMAIEVVGRCDQKIDPNLVCALGGRGDSEGLLGRQELRITQLGASVRHRECDDEQGPQRGHEILRKNIFQEFHDVS